MITVRVKYGDTNANIQFPCDESNLYATLSELHMPDEEKASPKLFIEEVTDFDELKCLEESFVDIDELNYFAKRLDGFDSRGVMKFKAAMSLGGLKTMPDLINLTFNDHYYTLIQDMRSPEKIGKQHYITRNGGMSEREMLETDFAKIGKNLIKSGQAKLTAYGLLIVNDDLEYERPYNGRTFPLYYYDNDKIGLTIEYQGEKEYIYLPDLPIAIKKAFNRLGVEKFEDCTMQLDNSDSRIEKTGKVLMSVLENNGIYAVNALTNNLKRFCTQEDLFNLPDIIDYVGKDDLDTIMMITEKADSFIILRDVCNDVELGKRWMDDYTDYRSSDDVMDFFDFESYGEYIREETNGKFMDNGDYICVQEGTSVEEIFRKIIEETSDMTMGGM